MIHKQSKTMSKNSGPSATVIVQPKWSGSGRFLKSSAFSSDKINKICKNNRSWLIN